MDFSEEEVQTLTSIFPVYDISKHFYNWIFFACGKFSAIEALITTFGGLVGGINRRVDEDYVKKLSGAIDTTCIDLIFGLWNEEDDDGDEFQQFCILDGQHRYEALKEIFSKIGKRSHLHEIKLSLKIIRLKDRDEAEQKIKKYNEIKAFDMKDGERKAEILLYLERNQNRLPWNGGWKRVSKQKPCINLNFISSFIQNNPDASADQFIMLLAKANKWMKKNGDMSSIISKTRISIEEHETYLAIDNSWVNKKF